jgi:hypothetical protein
MSRKADIKILHVTPQEAHQLFERIKPRIDPADWGAKAASRQQVCTQSK